MLVNGCLQPILMIGKIRTSPSRMVGLFSLANYTVLPWRLKMTYNFAINCSETDSLVMARSQDRFWGVQDSKKVDLLVPRSGLFEPHPLNPPTKTPFLAHFAAKSGPLGRLGGCVALPAPPLATGLQCLVDRAEDCNVRGSRFESLAKHFLYKWFV